jgi:hypothetical protein
MTEIDLPVECDLPPAGFEDAYELTRYDGGKYRLTATALAYVEAKQDEFDAAKAAVVQALEAERAAQAKTKELLRGRIVDSALDRVLKASGADPRALQVARAQLRSIWNFAVDGDAVTVVSAEGDKADLHQAIEFWLGDAGKAYSTRRPSMTATFARIQQITR